MATQEIEVKLSSFGKPVLDTTIGTCHSWQAHVTHFLRKARL